MNLQDQIRIRDRISKLQMEIQSIKSEIASTKEEISSLNEQFQSWKERTDLFLKEVLEKVSRGTVRGRPRKQVNG